MSERGKFVVIDGTDGSGKATQVALLAENLKAREVPFEVLDFPQYEGNIYGKLVGRYLKGEFGGIKEVSPYLASLAYAGDRLQAKPLIDKWLGEGKIVIANRYVPANKAHMGAKLPEDQREDFWKWIDELEYEVHGIQREDLVILLYVSPKINQENVDQKGSRNYMGGSKRDLHESDIQHLVTSSYNYLQLVQREPNWVLLECVVADVMRGKEEIQQEIIKILETQGIVKNKNE